MIGQTIASYRIERLLGAGGMGMVYEAMHCHLARRVAIKLLRPQFSADRDALSRFFTEARAANLAQHPSVLEVYEFGFTQDGHAYIVMEFIDGCSLQMRLDEVGRFGTRCLPIIRQLAMALDAVHAHGVVHRDLKPDNIMLIPDVSVPEGERVKILDFGIAKCLRPQPSDLPISKQATETGAILGTPSYLAPEQARGDRAQIGPAADVYALGAMFYELLAGRLPFEGARPYEQIFLHVFADPQPLRRYAPRVPRQVAELVHRMLRKDPMARPTMATVASELAQLCKRYAQSDIPKPDESKIRWSLLKESLPVETNPDVQRLRELADSSSRLAAAIHRMGKTLAVGTLLLLPPPTFPAPFEIATENVIAHSVPAPSMPLSSIVPLAVSSSLPMRTAEKTHLFSMISEPNVSTPRNQAPKPMRGIVRGGKVQIRRDPLSTPPADPESIKPPSQTVTNADVPVILD